MNFFHRILKYKNVFLLSFLFVFIFSCLFTTKASATIGSTVDGLIDKVTGSGSDDEKLSLSDVAEAAADYYGEAIQPQDDGVKGLTVYSSSDDNISGAGAFVGYGTKGWLASALSNSSNAPKYSSFASIPTDDKNGNKTNDILNYCRYGYVLSSLGLDTTGWDSSINFVSVIVGGSVLLLYGVAVAVPVMFDAVLSILKTLNPFNLFGVISGMDPTSANSTLPAVLAPLATEVKNWYGAIHDFSWAVTVPIFFAMLVVSLLLFKTTNKGSKIKKYIIRIGFLAIGMPLLGSVYTSVLDSMSQFTSAGNSSASKVVASTFCDFEAWANNSRLAVPDGATIGFTTDGATNAAGVVPTANSIMNVRGTCYAINAASGAIPSDGQSPFSSVDTSSKDSENIGKKAASWDTINTTTDINNDTNSGDVKAITNMLLRYSSSTDSFYHSSGYESKVKSELSQAAAIDSDTSKGINKLFKDAIKSSFYEKDDAKNLFNNTNYAGGYNVFDNGGLKCSVSGDSNSQTGVFSDKCGSNYSKSLPSSSNSLNQGLSSVSLYNYLNTSFNSGDMTVYSSEKASSGFVRQSHKSVSLVGTGMSSFLYWVNCLLLLGCFSIIGVFYAFSIVFANLKRGIRLIMAVPFAMLGAIRGIVKVITYTVMMLIEVIATIFLYGIVTQLILSISTIISAPFIVGLSSGIWAVGAVANAPVFIMIIELITAIVYIIFIKTALKLRKQVIKALDEASSDIISKFIDAQGVPEGKKEPGLIKKGLGAAASGAAMAAGNKLMSGGVSGGADAGVSGSQKTVATGDGSEGADTGGTDGKSPSGGDKALPGAVGKDGKSLTGPKGKGDDPNGDTLGLNKSAMATEREADLKAKLKKEKIEAGAKKVAEGGVKVGEGIAKGMAGDEAGAAKDIAEGSQQINEGKEQIANADKEAEQEAKAQVAKEETEKEQADQSNDNNPDGNTNNDSDGYSGTNNNLDNNANTSASSTANDYSSGKSNASNCTYTSKSGKSFEIPEEHRAKVDEKTNANIESGTKKVNRGNDLIQKGLKQYKDGNKKEGSETIAAGNKLVKKGQNKINNARDKAIKDVYNDITGKQQSNSTSASTSSKWGTQTEKFVPPIKPNNDLI